MSNRTILSGMALMTLCGAFATTAAADDWSISVGLSSGGSSYHAASGNYCAPRTYLLDTNVCRTYRYVPSVSYVETCDPQPACYSTYSTVPYTTTYTRSACYEQPVHHRSLVLSQADRRCTVRTPQYVQRSVSDCSSRRVVHSQRPGHRAVPLDPLRGATALQLHPAHHARAPVQPPHAAAVLPPQRWPVAPATANSHRPSLSRCP